MKWIYKASIVGIFIFGAVLEFSMAASLPQEKSPSTDSVQTDADQPVDTSIVKLDGKPLFQVRGMSGFTADARASAIDERIEDVAEDTRLSTSTIVIEELADRSTIKSGNILLANILDADAEVEKIPRPLMAEQARNNITQAILAFRRDRSPKVLMRRTGVAIAATFGMFLFLLAVGRIFRKSLSIAERHLKTRMDVLEARSSKVIESRPIWAAIVGVLNTLRFVLIIIGFYIYLNLVLGLFPWTRPIAAQLILIFVNPVKSLTKGFLSIIPNLAFLLVLGLLVRYFLKITRLFFAGIDKGTFVFRNFDRDWAWSTYRIVRWLIIGFAIVIAYPYIPGSHSAAFQGVSIFVGVLFSLGSSSFISNIIAGTTMTYRRAFKVGDIIKVNDVMGMVTDVRLQATHLRTYKNEEIVIPNAQILNGHIINFTTLSRTEGLVVSTTVGIGYETSWRQVEAMLLIAAERTSHLRKDRKPYVFQKSLGDFAVVYEIHVWCDEAPNMLTILPELHKNILDLFNEYGVQIMTPAYEGDPETPKVVAKKDLYAAPAVKGSGPDK